MASENQENQPPEIITLEYINQIVKEIRRNLTRKRSVRVKLTKQLKLYFEKVASATEEDAFFQGKIIEHIQSWNELIVETTKLAVSLSHPPAEICEIFHEFYQIGLCLETIVTGLYMWCRKNQHVFGSYVIDLLNCLLELAADSSSQWLYSVAIAPLLLHILNCFLSQEHKAIREDWAVRKASLVRKIAKAVRDCGDFPCQYFLMTVISDWSTWAPTSGVIPMLNEEFSALPPKDRKAFYLNESHTMRIRRFLNALNTCPRGPKTIISISCLCIFLEETELHAPWCAETLENPELWADFSISSGRLHVFYSRSSPSSISSLTINRNEVDSICLTWVSSNTSQDETRSEFMGSDSTVMTMTLGKDEKLMFLHMKLNKDFGMLTKDDSGLITKGRSVFIVFQDGKLAQRILHEMGYNGHTSSARSCKRPKALRNRLASQNKLNPSQTWSVDSQVTGLNKTPSLNNSIKSLGTSRETTATTTSDSDNTTFTSLGTSIIDTLTPKSQRQYRKILREHQSPSEIQLPPVTVAQPLANALVETSSGEGYYIDVSRTISSPLSESSHTAWKTPEMGPSIGSQRPTPQVTPFIHLDDREQEVAVTPPGDVDVSLFELTPEPPPRPPLPPAQSRKTQSSSSFSFHQSMISEDPLPSSMCERYGIATGSCSRATTPTSLSRLVEDELNKSSGLPKLKELLGRKVNAFVRTSSPKPDREGEPLASPSFSVISGVENGACSVLNVTRDTDLDFDLPSARSSPPTFVSRGSTNASTLSSRPPTPDKSLDLSFNLRIENKGLKPGDNSWEFMDTSAAFSISKATPTPPPPPVDKLEEPEILSDAESPPASPVFIRNSHTRSVVQRELTPSPPNPTILEAAPIQEESFPTLPPPPSRPPKLGGRLSLTRRRRSSTNPKPPKVIEAPKPKTPVPSTSKGVAGSTGRMTPVEISSPQESPKVTPPAQRPAPPRDLEDVASDTSSLFDFEVPQPTYDSSPDLSRSEGNAAKVSIAKTPPPQDKEPEEDAASDTSSLFDFEIPRPTYDSSPDLPRVDDNAAKTPPQDMKSEEDAASDTSSLFDFEIPHSNYDSSPDLSQSEDMATSPHSKESSKIGNASWNFLDTSVAVSISKATSTPLPSSVERDLPLDTSCITDFEIPQPTNDSSPSSNRGVDATSPSNMSSKPTDESWNFMDTSTAASIAKATPPPPHQDKMDDPDILFIAEVESPPASPVFIRDSQTRAMTVVVQQQEPESDTPSHFSETSSASSPFDFEIPQPTYDSSPELPRVNDKAAKAPIVKGTHAPDTPSSFSQAPGQVKAPLRVSVAPKLVRRAVCRKVSFSPERPQTVAKAQEKPGSKSIAGPSICRKARESTRSVTIRDSPSPNIIMETESPLKSPPERIPSISRAAKRRTSCYDGAYAEETRKRLEKSLDPDYDVYNILYCSELDEYRKKLFPKMKTYPGKKKSKVDHKISVLKNNKMKGKNKKEEPDMALYKSLDKLGVVRKRKRVVSTSPERVRPRKYSSFFSK